MDQEILNDIKRLYQAAGIICTNIKIESESLEYTAATFQLNTKKIIFRVAKITPTKIGQFVTIWKRNQESITTPFEYTDAFDFIIIVTRKENQVGQFIFPKSILLDRGIVSGSNKEGKRGIRVYPPWDKTESKQAKNTQQWQLNYFLDYSIGLNAERLKKLLSPI